MSDNQSAISWAASERFPSSRTKHIDIRVHFIRDPVKQAVLSVLYVPSEDNIADVLTKPLPPVKFKAIRGKLGIEGKNAEECHNGRFILR